MNEYALFIDGVFQYIKRLQSRPVDIPHKNVEWHPVSRVVDNTASDPDYIIQTTTEELVGDEYVITTHLRDYTAQEIDQVKTESVSMTDKQYSVEKALASVLFELVNEVRTMNSQPTITATQFRDYLKSKL